LKHYIRKGTGPGKDVIGAGRQKNWERKRGDCNRKRGHKNMKRKLQLEDNYLNIQSRKL
jgi:hypothetical protein